MSKVITSLEEVVKQIQDGSSIVVGGFGLCGIPEHLIMKLQEQGQRI